MRRLKPPPTTSSSALSVPQNPAAARRLILTDVSGELEPIVALCYQTERANE